MYRPMQSIIGASLLAIILSGCIGYGELQPKECSLTYPPTSNPMWAVFYDPIWSNKLPNSPDNLRFEDHPRKPSTKEDFLSNWGKPDKIVTTSETEETWLYERHLWCGIIPAFVIPVPLILPVCDGFDELVFQGNEASYLNTKRSRMSGCYFGLYGVCGSDSCWPQNKY